MDSVRSPRLDDPSRFGALAAALFSMTGYAACLFLSLIKLRTEHQCHSMIDEVCGERCTTTLHDDWSNLWGQPITVYGAALYLTAFVLACRAGSGPPSQWVRVPLLALAWLTLAISALYGFYAAFVLTTLCEYCALLYSTAIGLFLGALLLNGARGLRPFRALKGLRVRVTAGLTALGLVTALAVHVNLYARMTITMSQQRCETRAVAELPEPFLRVPSQGTPVVVAAVFIELSCPHCRDSVGFWRDYQATRSGVLELRYYHFPADCVGPTVHQACEAARAYECLAPAAVGREMELVEALLARQDGPAPYFSRDSLRAVAEQFEVAEFDACLERRIAYSKIVDEHLEFAAQHDLEDRPSALLIRMDGQRQREAIPLRGSKKDPAFLDRQLLNLINQIDPST
jgi:uncharacterized membrane protein